MERGPLAELAGRVLAELEAAGHVGAGQGVAGRLAAGRVVVVMAKKAGSVNGGLLSREGCNGDGQSPKASGDGGAHPRAPNAAGLQIEWGPWPPLVDGPVAAFD